MILSKTINPVTYPYAPLAYNPTLVKLPSGLWLIARCQETILGNSWLEANRLDDKYQIVQNIRLNINYCNTEDPRATVVGDKVYVFWNSGNPKYPIVTNKDYSINVTVYDLEWNEIYTKQLQYSGRQQVEKNWSMFHAEGSWWCLYSMNPWVVLKFNDSWEGELKHQDDYQLPWGYGQLRGGSLPFQVLPQSGTFSRTKLVTSFFTFFHSSYMPLRSLGKPRQYVGGLIAFEEKFPFRPLSISKYPVIYPTPGELTSVGADVAFPAGAINTGGKWAVSVGQGDRACQVYELLHEELISPLNSLRLNEG